MSSNENLIIDGVDWTLTERRHKRKLYLGAFIAYLIFLLFCVLIQVVFDQIEDEDLTYMVGVGVGIWWGTHRTWHYAKNFGRVFQNETGSAEYMSRPKEPKPSTVYRAPSTR